MKKIETFKDIGMKIGKTKFKSTLSREHGKLRSHMSLLDWRKLTERYKSIQQMKLDFDERLAEAVIKKLEKNA